MQKYIVSIFQGRLSRLQFILANLYLMLVVLVCYAIVGFPLVGVGTWVAGGDETSALYVLLVGGLAGLLFGLVYLAAGIGQASVIVRRLQDLNKPWWYLIITVIPIVNILFELFLIFAPGIHDGNVYGKRTAGTGWRQLWKLPKKK